MTNYLRSYLLSVIHHSSHIFFDLLQFNMHEEVTKSAGEDPSLEERSNLIKIVSLPSTSETNEPASNDQDVESSSSDQNIKTEKNAVLLLSQQLDRKGFCEGFAYIWGQWTSRPYIKVNGFGWIFKLVLWCLRYKTV